MCQECYSSWLDSYDQILTEHLGSFFVFLIELVQGIHHNDVSNKPLNDHTYHITDVLGDFKKWGLF